MCIQTIVLLDKIMDAAAGTDFTNFNENDMLLTNAILREQKVL